ncbi:MAG: SLBB domain-containing protein [Fimbriimonadaceae bacterium]
MWNELSGRQKGGLVGLAIVAALVAGYWLGRAGESKKPMAQEPLILESGTISPKKPIDPEVVVTLRVDVKGLVRNPGVFEMVKGSRVEDAIDAAGGTTEGADLSSVNLAKILEDGDQVVVKAHTVKRLDDVDWPIKINEASVEVIELLPGIGPVMAGEIVRYRSEVGPIEGVQDLERIPGFGPEMSRQILPYISFQ